MNNFFVHMKIYLRQAINNLLIKIYFSLNENIIFSNILK